MDDSRILINRESWPFFCFLWQRLAKRLHLWYSHYLFSKSAGISRKTCPYLLCVILVSNIYGHWLEMCFRDYLSQPFSMSRPRTDRVSSSGRHVTTAKHCQTCSRGGGRSLVPGMLCGHPASSNSASCDLAHALLIGPALLQRMQPDRWSVRRGALWVVHRTRKHDWVWSGAGCYSGGWIGTCTRSGKCLWSYPCS